MGRRPCCEKEGVNRGAWTAEEDRILVDYIKAHGEGRWGSLPKRAGLNRCGKSCRMRWLNYLRPDIKRGNISPDEEELIIRLHRLLGNRWSLIAGRLPGRTDNEIKNYWNTILGKRAQKDAPKARHCPDRPGHETNTKLQEDDTIEVPHSAAQPSVLGDEPSVSPAAFWAAMLKCSEVDTITTQVSIQQDEHDNCCFGINHGDPVPYPPFDRDIQSKSENEQVENYGPTTGFLSGFHRGDDADENAGEFDFGDVFLSDLLNTELSLDRRPAVSSEEAMVQNWSVITGYHRANAMASTMLDRSE